MKKLKCLNIIVVSLILLTACSNNAQKGTTVEKVEVQKVQIDKEETKSKEIPKVQEVKKVDEVKEVKEIKKDNSVAVADPSKEPTVTAIPKPTLKPEVKKPTEPIVNKVEAKEKEKEVIPKVVVQSGNKVIVIDPGHASKSNLEKEALSPGSSEMKIKDGGGAQGIVTKTPEYLINMKVAIKLKSLLEAKGFKVIMTKTDNTLSLGNIDRANIGNNANANLVIRIHADSSDNGSVTGASMLVPAGINGNTKSIHDESKRCGTIVLNSLTSEVGMKNRGVAEHSDMTGFNWSKVPVILVEIGFLSNENEDKLLSSEIYQNKIAAALFNGIVLAEK